jgi:ABC-type transport system substrate-binding protein
VDDTEAADAEVRFAPVASEAADGNLRPVIVERYYAEPGKAIEDLRKGKLDMIDRVLPTEAIRLSQDDTLTVGQYAFPSLHVLLPNPENPFLESRTFRRAILYAINRQVILEKGLLNDRTLEGCQVLSAPVPAGLSRNDPASYAYNDEIEPRPYDPVMAKILVELSKSQLATAAEKREEPAPELKELVLAHPTGELPRFVCNQIQSQLEVVGVPCSLRELKPGENLPEDGYDLVFFELMVREPLSDLGRLFGAGGAIPTTNPYVGLTLRRLEKAESWIDVRERLYELHRLLYEEVVVLPLWQMVDQFVYHQGLQGVRNRPVFLYEGVEQWRVVPPLPED